MIQTQHMKIVIIGNGMVGYKFCEKLASLKMADRPDVKIFGEEIRPAYDRVHLSEFFSGKTPDQLYLAPKDWYQEQGFHLLLGDPVTEIDRDGHRVLSHSGIWYDYDYLVMATGSSAFVPSLPGLEKQGVFVYRTIEDLEYIRSYAIKARKGTVMGGGLLGLEAAKALVDLGLEKIQVIEYAPRLMPRQIDNAASHILQTRLAEIGLEIITGANTLSIEGEDTIQKLRMEDGSILETDMLVISAGIRPRDELARKSGLKIGAKGGIVVDEYMKTSDPNIFAIGECALFEERIYGLVAPGYEMAEVALRKIFAMEPKCFMGSDMSTKLKLIGVDVASFGDPFIESAETRSLVWKDSANKVYKRINISSDGKTLHGGILIGDASSYNQLLQLLRNGLALPEDPAELIMGPSSKRDGSELGSGVGQLPNDALICSCENVTKERICQVIAKGAENLEEIKKCCKAGTGCGGCVPMLKDILHHEMKAKGLHVKNTLCEHFPYTRQELFDLIKIKKLDSYDNVLASVGHGDGCELCKPAISSILASLWNEMILNKGNDTAQDTNDRYLANIQKGGSYSVVPRIPGGEITPEKLIILGQIAKKYQLYLKITGGQRIDMFGAHLVDLPDIWEELVDAGFESGHAYGKAMRTVKSCVGSTWCRFGLHDSVSFAIRIEERYKGIRSPHKIKGAVSGCIRECAEAQSKDFGIIATEKGWNLYVCGNGGSKPQHAQLLASDLDDETCIRYLDRFLMFYIRTADPLTRTAKWLNNLEGGLDYLREVVVKDSLGLALEFESQMQELVDSFTCEWKEVVQNPELRKRFSHFVNAPDQKDPNIRFEPLRGQKRAVEWK